MTSNQRRKADDAKRIGRRIQELRSEKNIGQRELARLAEIDSGYLSRIESGDQSPGLRTFYRIATALGVAPAELHGT